MEPPYYWTLLRDIWIDAGFPSEDQTLWLELFCAQRTDRHLLMPEEERAALAGLSEDLVIYGGVNGPDVGLAGMSWTLSRDVAVWFARRFNSNDPIVGIGRCRKSRVLALFTGRGEDEIVIDPQGVTVGRRIFDDSPMPRGGGPLAIRP